MRKKRSRRKNRCRSPRIGDITREIAISKALSRVHGPFLHTCTACGQRRRPDQKEEHAAQCRPASIHAQPRSAAPPQLKKIDPDHAAKLRFVRLLQAKGKRVCPFCGKETAGLTSHILSSHRDQDAASILAKQHAFTAFKAQYPARRT